MTKIDKIILGLSLLMSLLLPQFTVAQTPYNLGGWQPNGDVKSIVSDNNYIYLGGNFKQMVKEGTLGALTHGTGVEPTGAGEVVHGFPSVDGSIECVVPDGSGGWFIGGSFTSVGGIVRFNIAHIMPDKTLDLTWNPMANSTVRALAISGGDLYVGGDFTTIGVQARNRIAKLSTTGTGAADATWNPNANGGVSALSISGGDLYVGGGFTTIGGQARSSIAKLSTTGTGAADATWNPNANGGVSALSISGGGLYVGGVFTSIGGQTRTYIAKLSTTGVGAADATWNPNANNSVRTLTILGGGLYVGGDFTGIGGQSRNRIAKLSTTGVGAADATWNPNVNGSVSVLSILGSDLYVGGFFTSIGGQSRNYIAKLSTTGAGAVDATWNPNANSGVSALSISGGDLYVGGAFTSIGGIECGSIVRLNKTTLDLDLTWNPNANSAVSALSISGGDLYVGGSFTSIGGQSRNYIAKLSTTGAGAADATWNPNANNSVSALSISGSNLYVGGWFSNIGGQTRIYIAKLSTTGVGAADATWNPNANSVVSALSISGSDLYVGGGFTTIGGQARSSIAKLNTTGAGAVDATWNPNPNGSVLALSISGSDLYVGGNFSTIGGQTRSNIAKLSTTGAGAADATWNPNASHFVSALSILGSDLYVGGGFTSIGGQPRNYIAKLNTIGTGAADATWNPNANNGSSVKALSISGSDLYVGGYFTSMGGNPISNFAVFRKTPVIGILGNSTTIVNGSGTPLATDHTDFGNVVACGGANQSRTFTIENTGGIDLTLSGVPLVNITGTGAAMFSVSTLPATTIIPSATTTFIINYTPTTSGSHAAMVSIASNDSNTPNFTFAIKGEGTDTTLPTITCPAAISVNNDVGVCGAVVTYAMPTFADNCTGSTVAQTAGLASGSTFPIGVTTNTFRVTDAIGNTADCSFTVTVTDNELPTITCPVAISVNNDVGVCGAVVTYTMPTFADNCTGSTVTQTAGLASGSTFPIGTTTNTFRVTDAIGNTADCSFTVTVADNENPTITCPAAISVNNDVGVCGAVVTYAMPTFADNCTGSTVAQTAGLASGSTFPIGTTTNTFRVTDAIGNTADCSFTVTVTDNENPTITCPAAISVNNDVGVCGAVVTYTMPTFADNCTGSTVAQTAGLASGATFPVGTTTNTFVVTDASGNTATCSFDVVVTDNENPTITCPAAISVNNDVGVCGAVVIYIMPTFTDNCTGSTVAQTAGLASGATFPVGTTTNTFVVTDASGNTATCSFDVVVTDNENPTITCPAAISVNNDVGVCGAVVTYTMPTFTDNCTGSTIAQTAGLASGSTFPIGVTTNTFRVTDAIGNTADCSFTVTVIDTELPTITPPSNIIVNADAGFCTATSVILGTATTADNCSVASVINNAPTIFPLGNTIITWTVTDDAGNFTTAQQTVEVNFVGSLAYSTATFNESTPISGEMGNTIIITVPCSIFTGTNGEDFIATNKAVVSNVPVGLTAELIRNADNELEFRLLGNAVNHSNADDISNLTLIFNNTAFSGGILASSVIGSNRNDLEINFETLSILAVANSVTNFTATSISTSQIRLNWTAATGAVTAYRLYRRGVLIATLQPNQTTYLDTNLNPDTSYAYEIETVNQTASSAKVAAKARTFPVMPTIIVNTTPVCTSGVSQVGLYATSSLFRVYVDSTTTTALLEVNGYTFDLPMVSQTTTFYISAVRIEQNQELESRRLAVTVHVDEAVEAIMLGQNNIISCENNTLLKAQDMGNGVTYTWLLNGQVVGSGLEYIATNSGNYSLRVSRGSCISTSNTKNVNLNFSPVASINIVRATFCQNGLLEARQIRNNATYEWILNGNVVENGTSLNVTQTGQYTLRVTENECIATTTAEVQIIDLPQVPQITATNLTLCPSETTTISFLPQNGVTYRWIRNGRVLRNTETTLTTNTAGVYQLEAIANGLNGCSVRSQIVEITKLIVNSTYLNISENKADLILTSQEAIESIEWFEDKQGDIQSITQWQNQTTVTPQENGVYFAKVIYSSGCEFQTRIVYFRIISPIIITGEDEKEASTFIIYPNPSTTGIFKVQFDIALLEDTEVHIFDGAGRVITTQTFEKGKQEFVISLDKVAKGLYLIRFTQDNKIHSHQIVID